MNTDTLLIWVGIALTLYGIVMLLFYLRKENGSMLDVISISWAGYILYIALAMTATGFFLPIRLGIASRGLTVAIMVLSTILYTIGLYAGKGKFVCKIIPRLPLTLNKTQTWLIWFVCMAIAILFMFGILRTTGAYSGAGGMFVEAALSALGMVSILVLFSYRGSYFSKFIMLITYVLIIYVLYLFTWSRRPLMGFFITATAFIYRFRLSWKSLGTRSIFISMIIVGGTVLLLFLGATRGERIYGVARKTTFSQENLMTFTGGITVNYEMGEYLVDIVPERIGYMYGKAFLTPFLIFIPRAIWKSKPVASDLRINEIVFGLDYKTNTGVTIVAEMYQNFGIFAPLGMFFIGKFVRGYNRYLRKNSANIVAWIAWFLIIPDFATEWRGGFTSMTGSIIVRLSFFLSITWLSAKIFNTHQQVDYDEFYYEGEQLS